MASCDAPRVRQGDVKITCVKCRHEYDDCCIVAYEVCWRCVTEWVYEHDHNPAKKSPEEIAFRIARGTIAVGGVGGVLAAAIAAAIAALREEQTDPPRPMRFFLVGDAVTTAVVAAPNGEVALRIRPVDIAPVVVFELLGDARPWVKQGVVVQGRTTV